MSKVEEKLASMGHTIPASPAPVANDLPAMRSGNLVFLSGVAHKGGDGTTITGKLGSDRSVEEGYEAAQRCALNLLANLKKTIGDLDKVTQIVKLLGMVNSAPDFTDHPKVINGASDLFVEAFGDKGRHARSAVGMGALPMNISVEIEAIVEVAD